MKNNPIYGILYMVVFCVVSALLLTVPKLLWSERIEENKLYIRKLAIVRAAGLHQPDMPREEVERLFRERVTEEDLGYLKLLVARDADGRPVAYLCDGEGMGHEGPFRFIASFVPSAELEAAAGAGARRSRTMKALVVYELNETPGLGGRIADPAWASQFGGLDFEVPKAGSTTGETEALINFTTVRVQPNDVVAVTGASNTMRSLNQSLNKLAIAMNKGLALVPLALGLTPDQVTRATPGYPKGFVPPPNLRKLDKRADFMVPEGLVNLAQGCPVTLVDGNPDGISGALSRITDWNKKSNEDDYVEFLPNDMLQTIQIDLGAEREVVCVVIWHYYKNAVVYRDVIVQCAEDADMKTNHAILFNNDYDNSAGLGKGTDQPYFAGWWGEIVDARPHGRLTNGRRARYVRVSTCGGEAGEDTRFVEIAVYGRETYTGPADGGAVEAPASEQAAPQPETSVVADAETTPSKPAELTEEQQMERMQADPAFAGMELLEPVALMKEADLTALLPPSGFEKPELYSDRPVRQFTMVPKGTRNLARGRPVTGIPGEDGEPLEGQLSQLTDGIVGGDGSVVELFPGIPQYVQVDLGEVRDIAAVAVWHGCKTFTVYRDVVVVLADDPEMTQNRRVIFNNDHDNSLELGQGKDPAYPATGHGRLFDARPDGPASAPARARFVRVYTNGSESGGEDNRLVEVAVFGK